MPNTHAKPEVKIITVLSTSVFYLNPAILIAWCFLSFLCQQSEDILLSDKLTDDFDIRMQVWEIKPGMNTNDFKRLF